MNLVVETCFINHTNILCCNLNQVFQEEFGIIKSYNLKAGGDKIPVNNQNRKGKLDSYFN